ncbi:MAG: hypothetical protein RLO37_31945 [Coleofasciculus chthonoplastes F1-TOW-03]
MEACRGGFSRLISSLTHNISAKPALTQNGGGFLKNNRQNILVNQWLHQLYIGHTRES